MFIKQLELKTDSATVLADLNHQLQSTTQYLVWSRMNQLGITSRPGIQNPWEDATGSLYNRTDGSWRGKESDFTEWNIPSTATQTAIKQLQEYLGGITFGRIRWMRLPPKTGLSVHKDQELRYHLVLQTNPRAYIAHETSDVDPLRSTIPTAAAAYHLPLDNHWYQVDTRQIHWVYNGGNTERIHLVVCGV